MFTRYTDFVAVAFITGLLLGCGGGGGGSSSTSNSPPNTANQEPPAIPSPTYQGLTTPANLSPTIAGQVAAFVFGDVDLTISYSENLINPFLSTSGSGTINSSQSGPAGGKVTLNGYVNSQTNAWVVESFTNYSFVPTGSNSTVILNGQLLVEVSGTIVTFGYTNYDEQGTGFNVVLSGNASQEVINGDRSNNETTTVTTTLNLGIFDNNADVDEEFVNFTVISLSGPNIVSGGNSPIIDRTVSGKVYDSVVGYLTISTQGNEIYSSDPTILLPLYGADALITGSSNTSPLLIGPLNYYFFSVGFSSNNDNVFNVTARYNWNNFTIDTTPALVGSGPVAIAEEATTPALNVPITLDGRFSHSPAGDYVQTQWSLLYATPGSHPLLANAGLPMATLTVDKPGDYLMLLTVTDGTQTSEDTVTVSIPSNNTPTESFPMFESVTGPDVTGQTGMPVQLDGRASFNNDVSAGGAPTYNWQLIAPAGSQATLTDATSAQPSFTPDIPGYYHVLLNYPSIGGNDGVNSALTMTVSVGEPIAFRPPVNFDGSFVSYYDAQFLIADINGDGKPDVLFYPVPGNLNSENPVNLYLNTGPGTFASPILLSAPGTSANGLFATVADLNGDGRPDIVVSGANTSDQSAIFVFLQNPDGTFSTPYSYSYSSNGFAFPVAVGHLFGSSSLSVVALDPYGDVYDLQVNSDGTLQNASVIKLQQDAWGSGNSLILADYNNDGLADIISNAYPSGVTLLAATNTNTFVPFNNQSYYSGSSASNTDLFGDGHNELLLAGQSALQVFSEQATNPVSYALTLANPQSVWPADLNGDGLTDIIFVYGGDCNTYGNGVCEHDVGMLFQQTDHSFGQEVLLPVDGASAGSLWVGDLNGDGIPDLMYIMNDQPVIQFGYKP